MQKHTVGEHHKTKKIKVFWSSHKKKQLIKSTARRTNKWKKTEGKTKSNVGEQHIRLDRDDIQRGNKSSRK